METPILPHSIPNIIYGTAFKGEETASLVESALKAGFRGIDTSGNKPQYEETLVGQGIASAIASGVVKRSDLFIQTKFSPYKPGRDPALYSYDTSKSIPAQVRQSVLQSLSNLQTESIDCLILHSLYTDMADTLTAWKAMEAFVPSQVLSLGLSNVDAASLQEIHAAAHVKPISVQNRFTGETAPDARSALPPGLPYPSVPFDRDVRGLCERLGVAYVPWGVSWGNAPITDGDPNATLERTAQAIGISKLAAWYACVRQLAGSRVSILCGTTKATTQQTVLRDLAELNVRLEDSVSRRQAWDACVEYIGSLVNGPELASAGEKQ